MFSFLFSSLLWASDPFVFIAPERTTAASQQVGEKLMRALELQLERDGVLYVLADESSLGVNDKDSGLDYLTTCLVKGSEAYRTCIHQISKANAWDYSINFEVKELSPGYRVETWIQDIESDDEIATPPLDIQEGGLEQWAQIVSLSYQNVEKNGIQHIDLRQEDVSKEELLRRMREQLKDTSMDDLTKIDSLEHKKEDITLEDIERMRNEEGVPPWEELGLTDMEYLLFYNTRNQDPSFSIRRWNSLMKGRKGRLFLGLGAGAAALPTGGSYYGYRLRSNFDLSIIETYAWQTPQNQTTPTLEASVGFGLTPELMISGFVGQAISQYDIALSWITIDNNQPTNQEYEVPQSIIYYGGRLSFEIPSIKDFRPSISVAASYWQLSSGTDYLEEGLQAEFPPLAAPSFLLVSVEPTGNVRMQDTLDVWFRVPLSYALAMQNAPEVFQSVENLQYTEQEPVPGHSDLGYGLMIGFNLQLDLFKNTEE